MSSKSVLTIGILAHVDAGKTSITECLLHHSGATKTLGNVDKGSAITDGLAMEKNRESPSKHHPLISLGIIVYFNW